MVEYNEMVYGKGNKQPGAFFDVRLPEGILTVQDPDWVHELYVTKNKFTTKDKDFKARF